MRFNEINLFGLYVAPIAVIMGVAWVIYLVVRRVGDRFGLTQRVWHPGPFRACALCYDRLVDRPYDCALEPLMSGVELKANDAKALPAIKRRSVLSSVHVVPILVTVAAVARRGAAPAGRRGNITWARRGRATARSAPMS